MTESRRKQSIARRSKVKSGCSTCKTRKVKCDEGKPFCARCINTGRACDGYDALFRPVVHPPKDGPGRGDTLRLSVRPTGTPSAWSDLELLNRCFTTKTMFDVTIDCLPEARQILLASSTNPSLSYAISALRTLRQDREMLESCLVSAAPHTLAHSHGLQQYTAALGGLCSSLSSQGFGHSRSALLCCQVFISIEQVREDYAAMMQHIIQGLVIMRGSRARPTVGNMGELIPSTRHQLPLLDVFLIKLFSTPCRFADGPASEPGDVSTLEDAASSPQQADGHAHLRTIAPDMRTKLTKIAALILEFLEKLGHVTLATEALRLQREKDVLLSTLKSWLAQLEDIQSSSVEPLSMSFTRLFHLILLAILMGSLSVSSDIQNVVAQLQDLGHVITEKVKQYHASKRARAALEDKSSVRHEKGHV